MRKPKTTLDDTLTDLLRARKKLEAEQGMVARRNARARFRRLLAQARSKLDEEYPVIKRKVAYRRKPNVLKRLSEKGYVALDALAANAHVLARLAAAGVRVVQVEREVVKSGKVPVTFVPQWAFYLAQARVAPEKIAMARKDHELRNALLVTTGLKGMP